MEIALPLEKMTIEEKIQVMETIWENLSKKAESVESPAWHKSILNDREEGIKNGTDEFVDWETAKKNIQNSV